MSTQNTRSAKHQGSAQRLCQQRGSVTHPGSHQRHVFLTQIHSLHRVALLYHMGLGASSVRATHGESFKLHTFYQPHLSSETSEAPGCHQNGNNGPFLSNLPITRHQDRLTHDLMNSSEKRLCLGCRVSQLSATKAV